MAHRSRNPCQTMETTTPFDLNRAIQRWRENLAQSPVFQRENLDELEAHLRDAVAALQASGLSAEESFLIGMKRIGANDSLEKEYGKVNGKSVWLDRVLWMLIGIQVWGLASGFIFSIARNAYAFGWRQVHYDWKDNGMALPATLFTISQVLAFAASMAFCWWLIDQKGSKIVSRLAPWLRRRGTFVATCIALCLFTMCLNVFSNSLSALLFWAYGREVVAEAVMYSNYATLWVSPFEIAVMIAATLLLMRKRLRLAEA